MLNDTTAIPFYCPIVEDYVLLEDFLTIEEAKEILSEAMDALFSNATAVEED